MLGLVALAHRPNEAGHGDDDVMVVVETVFMLHHESVHPQL